MEGFRPADREAFDFHLPDGGGGRGDQDEGEHAHRQTPPAGGGLLQKDKPLRAKPDDHIFMGRKLIPSITKKFGEHQFQRTLRALGIRHRDFYHTRHTFISVMLTHGENVKQIAAIVGTSEYMIYGRYGKYIGGTRSSVPKPWRR